MTRRKQYVPKEDPAAWAETPEGRVLLLIVVIVVVIVCFALGLSPNTGGHYDGGSGSSHKGGTYSNPATDNHYQKRR